MEMNKGKILLNDIAKHLAVSESTLPMALKVHTDLNVEMIENKKNQVGEWPCNPDPLARFTKPERSFTFGVVVPDITTRCYPSIICGIEEVANASGYNIVITSSQDSYAKEKDCLNKLLKLLRLPLDGLLVCLAQDTTDFKHFDKIIEANIPLVFFGRVCRTNELSSVTINLEEAVQNLTIHFSQRGASRIAYLEGLAMKYGSRDKIYGYKNGLQTAGLSFDEKLLVYPGTSAESATMAINGLLSLKNPPDAIIGADDAIISLVLKQIKRRGLEIPQHISLGGFVDECAVNDPESTITAIACPHVEMGREAIRLLLQEIKEGKGNRAQQICLQANLMVRDMTRPSVYKI
jgi:DNA-binding LacI/PurR family transcriptional regulator